MPVLRTPALCPATHTGGAVGGPRALMRLLLVALLVVSDRALVMQPLGGTMAPRAATTLAARDGGAVCSTTSDTTSDLTLYHRLCQDAKEETQFGRALGRSLSVMRDAFRLYGPERVVASFNGGKDAIVTLHLSLVALAAHNEAVGGSARLRVIFFEMEDEFPEIEEFVRETIASNSLDLVSCAGVGFADGLRQCIAEHDSAAFVLGTRGSDPNAAGQQDFTPSSDWMPPFMRVNPILTWSYHDVWAFLRTYELPYCTLYDVGYTSLGKVSGTQRNPELLRADGSYAPAWQLTDGSLERAGRSSAKKADGSAPAAAAAEGSGEGADSDRVLASTAALLIVGDEILGGKQQDVNTLVAARTLRAAGVGLGRVCVVADDMEEIVCELRRLTSSFDVVLTSGGLGPTHDDITLKGVAEALRMDMRHSEEMAQMITSRYEAAGKKDELTPEVLTKMSTLPSGVRIRTCASDEWPILQCANVFVLPGVPAYFTSKLETSAHRLIEHATTPVNELPPS